MIHYNNVTNPPLPRFLKPMQRFGGSRLERATVIQYVSDSFHYIHVPVLAAFIQNRPFFKRLQPLYFSNDIHSIT